MGVRVMGWVTVLTAALRAGSGQQRKIEIKARGALSPEEVQRMIEEARANADVDRERQKRAEVSWGGVSVRTRSRQPSFCSKSPRWT